MNVFLLLLGVIVFGVKGALPSGEIDPSAYSHILVIPDIHGDYRALIRSLWLGAEKIEGTEIDFDTFSQAFERSTFSPSYDGPSLVRNKDVAVVQLGDVVDRGPYGVACIFTLGAVEKILGWRLVQLYGNHEIMNFLDRAHQFIHPREPGIFGSWEARSKQFQPGGGVHAKIASSFLGVSKLTGDTLFVHGGVDLNWLLQTLGVDSGQDLTPINSAIQSLASHNAREDLEKLNQEESIFWTRDLANESEDHACVVVEAIKSYFNVRRVIVGHTPQEDMVAKTRCGGSIILADVMMSRWMVESEVDEEESEGGRPVAIVMTIDRSSRNVKSIIAHYTDLEGFSNDKTVLLREEVPRPIRPVSRGAAIVPLEALKVVNLVNLHDSKTAIFQAEFGRSSGLAQVNLDGRAVDMRLVLTIGRILGMLFNIESVSEVAADDLAQLQISNQLAAYPYFFVRTSGVRSLNDLVTSQSSNKAVSDAVSEMSSIAEALHNNDLLIGFGNPELMARAFVADERIQTVQLGDWSHVRGAENQEEIEAEIRVIELVGNMLKLRLDG